MKFKIKNCLAWLLVASLSLCSFLPPKYNGSGEITVENGTQSVTASAEAVTEETRISSRLLELLFGKEEENERLLLIPGGGIFGAKIKQSYVSVQNPGDWRDIKVGDKIVSINGNPISSVQDAKRVLSSLGESEVTLSCQRNGKDISVKLKPKLEGGEYKLGMVLKDGAAGIGTITYIDPVTGLFGGLGHGICDTDTGEVIDFTAGEVTGVILSGVKKGEEGKPGELSGMLTDKVAGVLYANTECGVFGKLDTVPESLKATALQVAHRDEVHEGEATVLSTVKVGQAREFKIEISHINKDSTGTKSFRIKVTDPALIAITGGVVRGMSGSPIIQDGKLIGAVTHVMVANPTEGYGIFIENMLSAAQLPMAKAS
jgi:stage IV sporulation protein B